MKTAVIYARYSSDSQTEQSIEGQLRVCEEYAKTHDILVLNTYIDRAMTGTNDNRPDFQRMIRESNRKEWDYVLVYKFDRFSRNKYETAIHKKTLRDNGTKVISATEFIPNTPEGIIFESMLEGYAEYYSAELSQKIRRGNEESRLKGNLTGGTLPYGYKNVNKKAVIVDEDAAVVRYIYAQYSKDVYVKDIIAALTAKGILYNNKPFARNTVYKILKNERYLGIYRHDGTVYDHIYPQIIDEETFERVRKKVDKNKYGKRSTTVVYLLRNKITCGYCGSSVIAECGTAKSGSVKRYYKCSGRKHGRGCKKEAIRKDVLENIVLKTAIKALSDPKRMDAIVKNLLLRQEQTLREKGLLNTLIKEKRQAENALNNVMAAIERGVVNNTTQKRMVELENRCEELDKQILIEKSKNTVKLTEIDLKEHFLEALALEPKLLINFLVKQIILYDDKIQIYFNAPLRGGPDEDRGFSFYSEEKEYNAPAARKILLEMLI